MVIVIMVITDYLGYGVVEGDRLGVVIHQTCREHNEGWDMLLGVWLTLTVVNVGTCYHGNYHCAHFASLQFHSCSAPVDVPVTSPDVALVHVVLLAHCKEKWLTCYQPQPHTTYTFNCSLRSLLVCLSAGKSANRDAASTIRSATDISFSSSCRVSFDALLKLWLSISVNSRISHTIISHIHLPQELHPPV